MIVFKENQSKIYVGKNKITKSSYNKVTPHVKYLSMSMVSTSTPHTIFTDDYIDLHLIYPYSEKSGYPGKFVRVITLYNIYDLETIKSIKPQNIENEEIGSDFMNGFKYFENGGYEYNKSTF